jgi:hypothetical protein
MAFMLLGVDMLCSRGGRLQALRDIAAEICGYSHKFVKDFPKVRDILDRKGEFWPHDDIVRFSFLTSSDGSLVDNAMSMSSSGAETPLDSEQMVIDQVDQDMEVSTSDVSGPGSA